MSNDVMQAVGVFFSYAVLAIFAQNAVFTRGLGVSRLVQLVGDERTSSGWFALLLCVTQVLVAPLAFYAGGFAAAQPNFAQLRPLVYLACVAVVSLFEFLVLWAARGRRHGGQLLRILPAAAVNSGVLGTVLVERTQSFTLEQSMGFGLGSGLGYLLAVMLVTEADHRLRSEAIPEAFRGLPGGLNIFSDGRALRDTVQQRFFDERFARLAAVRGTEAIQPNDGRFTILREQSEWMSRHAHAVEKFCMFFHSAEEARQYLPRFTAIRGVEVVQGSPDNIEVTAAGVNKGESLLALADYLGIPREATLAVGDSENDRAMLEKAGVAAVMANGMPQIKALADLVTTADCDHDGVAEVFETLGL